VEAIAKGRAGGGRRRFIAGWGRAQLFVTPDSLEIRAETGTVSFRPNEVTSIERFLWVPYLAWGFEIHHNRRTVLPRFVFFTWRPPESVMQAIEGAGFVPSGSDRDWSD